MLRKLQQLRKKEEGFTIIEVLIVLAIAALILVIVLIAIPQLQRNQRNTARQNDAARVLTSVQNWSANNNGKVFTAGTGNANLTAVINDTGSEIGQYTLVAGTTLTVVDGSSTAIGANTSLDNLIIVTGAQCDDNGVTKVGATRDVVVQYAQEGADTENGRCVGGS
jgi:prepilin-type N-terminal cleavage/methylation domain-containing protein